MIFEKWKMSVLRRRSLKCFPLCSSVDLKLCKFCLLPITQPLGQPLHSSISDSFRVDRRRFLNGPEEKLAPISFLVYLLAITFYERETDWPHSEAAEIMAQLSEDGREGKKKARRREGKASNGLVKRQRRQQHADAQKCNTAMQRPS